MWLNLLFIVGVSLLVNGESPKAFYRSINDVDGEVKVSPLVDPYDGISYRIPNDTIPLTYDIWISTDIHRGEFAFDGRVNTLIEVVESTPEIVMQYRLMTIQSVNLFSPENVLIEENVDWFQNDTVEFLVITPSQPLVQGQRFIVQIFYNGTIRDNGLGIYRSQYTDPSGNQVWLATTQFQANEARHAFPCYDEPAIRSLFTVSIRHDASYTSLSNMPVESITPEAGTNYVVTKFDESVLMQTYLVAFTVSDYSFIEDATVVPPQRIYGKRHAIENGDGDLALDVSLDLMVGFEDYVQIPYSLPKIDQFACPDFAFGAMENWGLAVYREPFLLFDPVIDRTLDRDRIINIIAHEFCHMWFGNLVGPAWWTYLWFNEGFAALYEFYIPHLVYPEAQYMDTFLLNYLHVAMELDANLNVRAMSHYVENPDRIEDLFDFVSYNKAGSILHMMQNSITDETWRKGLNIFLNERQFNSTNSAQLYSNIQIAVDEDIPVNTPDISAIMSTFELQAGLPLVTISRSGPVISFHQERFFYGNDMSENIWSIPINYVVGSNPDFSQTTADLWLGGERTQTIQSDTAPKPWTANDWIIVNIQQKGYYRVNYDNTLWNQIIAQLNSGGEGFAAIHRANRAQLIDDSFHLARARKVRFYIPMDIMNYMWRETEFVPWGSANRASTLLNRWLTGTSVYVYYRGFIRRNTEALYNKLGVNIIANEPRVDRYARNIAIDLACQAGAERCLADTAEELERMISSGNPIAPDLVAPIYCNGLRRASEDVVEFMQNEIFEVSRQLDRNRIITALGCIEDSEILYSHLFLALRPDTGLSNAERSSILLSPLNHGESSLRVMMAFIRLNYGGINLINSNQVSILCNNIAARVASESVFTEFNSLLSHLVLNGALTENAANNFRTSARGIIEWQIENLNDFVIFFGRHPIEL